MLSRAQLEGQAAETAEREKERLKLKQNCEGYIYDDEFQGEIAAIKPVQRDGQTRAAITLFRLHNILTVCQQYPLQANTESALDKILKVTTTSRSGARPQRVD